MNFYKNLTDGKKSALIGGIIILVLFTIIYFYGQKRKEKLNKNPYITIGIVEKLMPNASKSTITEKDVIYFYFVRNDTVYHKITDLLIV